MRFPEDWPVGCPSENIPATNLTVFRLVKHTPPTVTDFLSQPRLWVVDLSFEGAIAGAWLIAPKDVPDDALPQPGTMLHRERDPAYISPSGSPMERV